MLIDTGMTCFVCGEQTNVKVNDDIADDVREWLHTPRADREHVQDAFPELDAGTREELISGTHSQCFDDMFGEDDD